ncbi:MAG: hypothetical protein AAFQ37_07870 [Bacteroidota bacterium]
MWKEKLALYDALIDQLPDVERKGKTMPYTSANGHMFSQLNKAGEIGIRLPKMEREKFMVDHQTTLFTAYNTVMKEYVLIPDTFLNDLSTLANYLEMGHQYVKSLKPK